MGKIDEFVSGLFVFKYLLVIQLTVGFQGKCLARLHAVKYVGTGYFLPDVCKYLLVIQLAVGFQGKCLARLHGYVGTGYPSTGCMQIPTQNRCSLQSGFRGNV